MLNGHHRHRIGAGRAALAIGLAMGLSPAARAQLVAPAPVRQSVDANGVDLFAGTMNADAPGVSIGADAPQGLSYYLLNRGAGWRDNLTATLNQSGTVVTVSLGGVSDAFTVSGSSYSATQGNGATLTLSGNKFTYTARDGTVVHFDKGKSQGVPLYANDGLATDRVSPDGSRLVYAYDSIRYCSRSKPGGDGDICTGHSNVYRLSTITNSYGYRVAYSYGDEGIVDPDDPNANLNDFMNPTGSALVNAENASGPGASYSTSYSGSTLTVTGTGRTVSYRMSGAQIAGITRAGSSSENVTVGYSGSRVSSVSKAGGTWGYTAGDSGNTRTVTVTDPLNHATVYTFDIPTQVMTSMTDALGRKTSWTLDASGRITLAMAPDGNSAAYTYDARGNVTQTVVHAKPSVGGADITTSATFPATCANTVTCNEPTSVTDAQGNVTSFTYDQTHGGVLTATAPAPTNGAVQPQVRTTYTQFADYFDSSTTPSKIWKVTGVSTCRTQASCAGNSDEIVTSISYGSLSANNLLPVSTSRGAGDGSLTATTTVTYDTGGNAASIDGPLPGAADTTTIQYGTDRKPTLIVSADPGHDGLQRRAVRTTYAADGQVILVEVGTANASGGGFNTLRQVSTEYDNDGRKLRVTASTGSTAYQVLQYSYDTLSRVTCATQRMNPANWTSQTDACTAAAAGADGPDRISYTHYDELGRPDYVTSAYGTGDAATERANFGLNGKIANVTDANGNVTTYGYDAYNRLSKIIYPSSTSGSGQGNASDYEELGYDAASNVTARHLRDGQLLRYDYDALGRRVYDHNPQTNVAEVDKGYTYDLLGELLRAQDTNGWYNAYSYDALGRPTTVSSNLSSNTLGYDLAGRRVSQAWADGFYVTYDYDVMGEMTGIHENGGALLATFSYDNWGRRTGLARQNGAQTSYGFTGPYLTGFSHDLAGTANDLTVTLGYNAAGQIASRSTSNDAYSWTGAANVNRGYSVNGLNQYTQSGSVTPGYDARGNLTQAGGPAYSYNTRNELYSSGPGTLYYRGPSGMLGQILRNDGTGQNLDNIGDQLTTEFDTNGQISRRYVYGPGTDEPLVWYEGSGTGNKRFLHADERGSVIAVSDAGGNALAINTYDEFGIPGANNQGRFQYTGQKWIPELGMYDYKARMYSPTLGRFMQTDPIGYGDGLNWYNYVAGDPINGVDPSGTHFCDNQVNQIARDQCYSTYNQTPQPGDIVVTGSPPPRFSFVSTPPVSSSSSTSLLNLVNVGAGAGISPPVASPTTAPQSPADREKQTCRNNPLFRNAFANPAVKKALSGALALSKSSQSFDNPSQRPETAFIYGKSVFGGYGATPSYTTNQSGSVDPGQAPYRLIRGIYTDEIFFHIHSPPNDPGLSGTSGDIGFSNSSGVPIVAVDYDGTAYCYSPG